ncbi:secreted frizzled-related protein 2 precursor [Silurus asotus]|uniref:Secreted frizzled-related protein 2 n=1 Tax=Silurus asotus TaxID=30991 RepID=A0AAD5A5Y3_SILAS|nr:secreted frizzled-related protein 2 precursor [Silurus asotus]
MRSLLSAVLACAVHYALAMYGLDHAELHHRSSCTPIPTDLYLCRGIEYARMRLPNLLGHETLSEAAQQAAAWVPLVHKHCHTDTRKFLCSLFAPVCLEDLDEPIQPCRSLCEAVRSACAPVMAAFGFPWPEMLECTRFPEDNDLCIPPARGDTETPGPVAHGVPKVCDACKEKLEDENEIVDSLCKNNFVLKIKVKEISYMNGDTKLIPDTKSKIIYKLNGVTEHELRKPLWLRDGLECMCDEMSDISATYLVMGQNLDGNLVITSLKRWQKGQREIKRLYRSIRKLQC